MAIAFRGQEEVPSAAQQPRRGNEAVDTQPNVEQALLEHAQRQTKALENINYVVMALFVLVLVGIGLALIV
jgi:hypothetical protein